MVTPMLRVIKTLFWSTNPFIIFSKKRKTSTNKSPVNYDQKERKKKKKEIQESVSFAVSGSLASRMISSGPNPSI